MLEALKTKDSLNRAIRTTYHEKYILYGTILSFNILKKGPTFNIIFKDDIGDVQILYFDDIEHIATLRKLVKVHTLGVSVRILINLNEIGLQYDISNDGEVSVCGTILSTIPSILLQ